MKQIQQLLKEGAMDEEKIYDSTEKLVNLCRECNVTLRWLILHSIPRYAGMKMKLISSFLVSLSFVRIIRVSIQPVFP